MKRTEKAWHHEHHIAPGSLIRPWKEKTILMRSDRACDLGPKDSCLVIDGEYHGFSDRFYYKVLVGGVIGWLRDCDVEVVSDG